MKHWQPGDRPTDFFGERTQRAAIIDIRDACHPRQNSNDENAPPPNLMASHLGPQPAEEEQKRELDAPRARVEENGEGNNVAQEHGVSVHEANAERHFPRLHGLLLVQHRRLDLPQHVEPQQHSPCCHHQVVVREEFPERLETHRQPKSEEE